MERYTNAEKELTLNTNEEHWSIDEREASHTMGLRNTKNDTQNDTITQLTVSGSKNSAEREVNTRPHQGRRLVFPIGRNRWNP